MDFDDWPLDNVRSCRFVMKEMRKTGKTWLTASNDWANRSGIRASDRACHEHKVLSKALDLACGFDQLNMYNCAVVEVLVKRRMLIESAYKGRPDAPRFEGSEHLMGFRDDPGGEFIDSAAIKFAAQKMRMETEVLREHRLKKEEDTTARSSHANKGGGKGGAEK